MASSGVGNIDVSWQRIIRSADPDWPVGARRQPAYTFEAFGRVRRFWTDPLTEGAYSDTRKFLLDEYGNIMVDQDGNAILVVL